MPANRVAVLGLVVIGLAALAAVPARADGHDGWHGGWHGGWHRGWHHDDDEGDGPRWGVVVAPPPAYYAPPPVYYAPPPPPPPVYYAPPPPVVFAPGLTVGIGIH